MIIPTGNFPDNVDTYLAHEFYCQPILAVHPAGEELQGWHFPKNKLQEFPSRDQRTSPPPVFLAHPEVDRRPVWLDLV